MSAAVPPKVFISYSHDSEEHKARVLALADELRGSEGIDARIDQYIDSPPEGWPRWMAAQVVESDFTLIVCTPQYLARFERNDAGGKGVQWEALIAEQILYEAQAKNTKLLPVLFEGGKDDDVPIVLRAYMRYYLPRDYEALVRRIQGKHKTPPPPLGKPRDLPPAPRPRLVVATSPSPAAGVGDQESVEAMSDDELIDELARVLADEGQARLVVQRAGLPTSVTPPFRTSLVFWADVVRLARSGAISGGVTPVAEAAAKLFPGNAVLRRYRSG